MKKHITKIIYDDWCMSIRWVQGEDVGMEECSLKCKERPSSAFLYTLRALDQYVAKVCELPNEYSERIVPCGVGINYSKGWDKPIVTVTAQMKLLASNVPLTINTPNKVAAPPESQAGTVDKVCMQEEYIDTLYVLLEEAEKYLDGERAQGNLYREE